MERGRTKESELMSPTKNHDCGARLEAFSHVAARRKLLINATERQLSQAYIEVSELRMSFKFICGSNLRGIKLEDRRLNVSTL